MNIIAISKRQNTKFKKHCYVTEIIVNRDSVLTLFECKGVEFGYLQAGFSRGAKRGWKETAFTMEESDFKDFYNQIYQEVNIKIK